MLLQGGSLTTAPAKISAEAQPQPLPANAGFEQVSGGLPVSWSVMSGTVASSASIAHSGSYSVQLTDGSATASVGLRSQKIPVEPGKEYEASVYSNNVSGASQLYFEFWDANNQLILNPLPIAGNNTMNQWKQLVINQIAPAGAKTASLRVYSGQGNVGTSYFDDASFQLVVQDPNSLLKNGGMELETDGKPRSWSAVFAGQPFESAQARKRTGERSVKIVDTNASGGIGIRSELMPVTAGVKYEAEVFAYIESGAATIFIEYWEDVGKIMTDKNVIVKEDTPGQWKPIRAAGPAPAGAKYATVRLYLAADNVGTTYFDDAKFGLAPPKASANLNNGRFERLENGRPADWREVDGTVDVSTSPVQEGARSVKVVNAAGKTAGLRSHLIPVSAGALYTASVYASAVSGTPELRMEFWDADKVFLSQASQAGASGNAWTTVSLSPEIPEGAAYASLRLSTLSSAAGEVYFDNATFTSIGQSSKTATTLYDAEKVANARYNVQQYPWATEMKNAAVAKADAYLAKGWDYLWKSVPSQGLPRSYAVNKNTTSPVTGVKIDGRGNYPFEPDPNAPWKIIDPIAKVEGTNENYRFPTNDFQAYYESGLDEHGLFQRELADPALLVNTLYPDKGAKWGVDDGFGWKASDGTIHTFVAYYVHWMAWYGERSFVQQALNTLRDAYLYTGDAKYAKAGIVLLDRVADVYPEMDISQYDNSIYVNSSGKSYGKGKVLGGIWETELVKTFISAYDAFFPAMEDPQVVSFLDGKARQYRLTNKKNTGSLIKRNIEDGIIEQVYPAVKKTQILGNDGMHQSALAMAAVVYNTMPATGEWLDFIFKSGQVMQGPTQLTGGNMLNSFVRDVDRDGMGNEASPAYNALWLHNHRMTADVLDGYGLYPNANLYDNPKFRKMFSAAGKLILSDQYTPAIGDTGRTGNPFIVERLTDSIKAFEKFNDPIYAQQAYFLNNNSSAGLHADVFTANPNAIANQVQAVINQHGPLSLKSDNMFGYGFGALRDGKSKTETGGTASTLRDLWMYYGASTHHGHMDTLNIGLHAYGLDLAPDLGYPDYADNVSTHRSQWMHNTISHNTVVVDKKKQMSQADDALTVHADDTDRVKLIDVQAPGEYTQTSLYRRTTAMIKIDAQRSYAVDFFRVKGGNDHYFSFHSAEGTVATQGLQLTAQPTGTYAGPDVDYGVRAPDDTVTANGPDGAGYKGSGFHYLKNVERDASPSNLFSIDWNVKDTWNVYGQGAGAPTDVHLRLTMVGQTGDVALADGVPPTNKVGNPAAVRYLIAHNGGTNIESNFISVIEPYRVAPYISIIEPLIVKHAGAAVSDIEARAVRVTLANGRTDVVISALDASKTYTIEGANLSATLTFKGAFGCYSETPNGPTHTYVHDGAYIGTSGTTPNRAGAVTGTIEDFTRTLAVNNEIIVNASALPSQLSELNGKTIIIQNDGRANAAYRIKGATVISGTQVKLDIGDVTLIRAYANPDDFQQGYVYNISPGMTFRIPLTYAIGYLNGGSAQLPGNVSDPNEPIEPIEPIEPPGTEPVEPPKD